MHKIVPAFEFRRRARQAMQAFMPVLLVVALIATLPSLVSTAVTALTGADTTVLMEDYANRMLQVMEKHGLTNSAALGEVVLDEAQYEADLLAAMAQFMQRTLTFLEEKGLILFALAAMVLILSPMLTMGLINALLHALRRQEFTASIALSRVRYLIKTVGLEMLAALKVLLWMLPGMAIGLLGVYLAPGAEWLLAQLAPDLVLTDATLLLLMGLSTLLSLGGMAAAIIPGVMASYRYAMAVFFMADDPEMGVRDCIRRSCEVMQRRKMELFSLELSFIGWRLALSWGRSLLVGMLGSVIGTTLGLFAALFLTVYTSCAQTAFYQEYAVGPLPQGEEEPGMAP